MHRNGYSLGSVTLLLKVEFALHLCQFRAGKFLELNRFGPLKADYRDAEGGDGIASQLNFWLFCLCC